MKFHVLRFEPVGRGVAAAQRPALERHIDRHVEDEREVGQEIADGDPLEALDQAPVDLAERALIDAGGIGEAVAHHPFAGGKRRLDGAADMVFARRREQHGFGVRARAAWRRPTAARGG